MTDQAPEQPTTTDTTVTPVVSPPAERSRPQRPSPEAQAAVEVSHPIATNADAEATRESDLDARIARDEAVEERVAKYDDPAAQDRVREQLTREDDQPTNTEENQS